MDQSHSFYLLWIQVIIVNICSSVFMGEKRHAAKCFPSAQFGSDFVKGDRSLTGMWCAWSTILLKILPRFWLKDTSAVPSGYAHWPRMTGNVWMMTSASLYRPLILDNISRTQGLDKSLTCAWVLSAIGSILSTKLTGRLTGTRKQGSRPDMMFSTGSAQIIAIFGFQSYFAEDGVSKAVLCRSITFFQLNSIF